jgi:hypothetical protein
MENEPVRDCDCSGGVHKTGKSGFAGRPQCRSQ